MTPDGASRALTLDERNAIFAELSTKKSMTFKAMRKLLKLPTESTFNKESERRDGLTGNETDAIFGHKKAAGDKWFSLDMKAKRLIADAVANEEDLGQLQNLIQSHLQLDEDQLIGVCNVSLTPGFSAIGESAATAIVSVMANEVCNEYAAAKAAGLKTTDKMEEYDALPPYQEILATSLTGGSGNPDDEYDDRVGRIANPTVHIGLNQLRKLVNRYIRKYGKPAEISVEIARELAMSPKRKAEYEKALKTNTANRDKIKKTLVDNGVTPTASSIELVKIWQEMPVAEGYDKNEARACVYTGVALTFDMVINGEVEVDHILPFSLSLDDSANNKVVCLKAANQIKGQRAPSDVFEWQDRYTDILKRARHLNLARYKRFSPTALDEFRDENKFLARHLVDTQYLSKVARVLPVLPLSPRG